MAKPWSIRSQILILAIAFGLGGAAFLARDHIGEALANLQKAAKQETENSSHHKNSRAPVIVAKVGKERDDLVIAAIGTARAKRSVTIYSKSEGEIIEFPVSAGDRVTEGQELLKLDLRNATLAVDYARKSVDDARQKHERALYLRDRKVSSRANVEDAAIAVDRAEIQLRQAEEALRERTIRAPFSGVIGIPKVELGDRINPQTALLTLDDRTELFVEFKVPEKFLPRLKLGNKIEGRTPGYGDKPFAGSIGKIDSRIEPVSRTIMVRAVFPNADDLLRPGMSFTIELPLPGNVYPSVPELSLQWNQGDSFVWLVKNKKAKRTVVRTIRRRNEIVLIDGPVVPGDLVVTEGVQRLRDGKDVIYHAEDDENSEETGTGTGKPNASSNPSSNPDEISPAAPPQSQPSGAKG